MKIKGLQVILCSPFFLLLPLALKSLTKRAWASDGIALLVWREMKQPKIGAMMGIDYSAMSVGRKWFLGIEEDLEHQLLFTRAKTRITQG
jgi:hypothetical protein